MSVWKNIPKYESCKNIVKMLLITVQISLAILKGFDPDKCLTTKTKNF